MNISPRLQLFSDRAALGVTEAEFRAKRPGVYDPDPYGFSDPLWDLPPPRPTVPRCRERFLSPFGKAVLFTAAFVVVGTAGLVFAMRLATILLP